MSVTTVARRGKTRQQKKTCETKFANDTNDKPTNFWVATEVMQSRSSAGLSEVYGDVEAKNLSKDRFCRPRVLIGKCAFVGTIFVVQL